MAQCRWADSWLMMRTRREPSPNEAQFSNCVLSSCSYSIEFVLLLVVAYGRHSARTRLRAGSPWHAETGSLLSYVARHMAVCSELGADRACHLGAFDLTAGTLSAKLQLPAAIHSQRNRAADATRSLSPQARRSINRPRIVAKTRVARASAAALGT
jgi:hypothetical protein